MAQDMWIVPVMALVPILAHTTRSFMTKWTSVLLRE